MSIRVAIIATAIFGLLAIPLLTALPEPISTVSLIVITIAFPFFTVWLLQEEAKRSQNQGNS